MPENQYFFLLKFCLGESSLISRFENLFTFQQKFYKKLPYNEKENIKNFFFDFIG